MSLHIHRTQIRSLPIKLHILLSLLLWLLLFTYYYCISIYLLLVLVFIIIYIIICYYLLLNMNINYSQLATCKQGTRNSQNTQPQRSSTEAESEKKAQSAILKSFKGKLVADFRHKNANVQVRAKTSSWPEAVRKKNKFMQYGTFTNGGKNCKSKTSPTVDLDHQCCFEQGAWRQRKDYFNINSVILRKGPQRRKNLKSAIQNVINSVNKPSCLPKQKDKEWSLCLKFNTAVYCLTKISIRAKRSISRVFSLFIVPSPFFCTLPVQRPY